MNRRYPISPTPEHAERLARHTVRGQGPDDCWGWNSLIDIGGYGRVTVYRVKHSAHRLSYTIHYGIDPGDLQVCHSCDNPPCTNPRHLFLGTQADNLADAREKGRWVSPSVPGVRRNIGANNPHAKFSDDQVALIRDARRTGLKFREIAELFGVSQSYAVRIANGVYRATPTP